MMVTLTKLFVIRIVASVRSESSRNIEMLLSAGFFSGSRLSRSCGDKLKNAISEPLAKPDNKSKKAARRAANRTPVVIGWKTTRSLMCCMSVKSNFTYYLLFAFNYFRTKSKRQLIIIFCHVLLLALLCLLRCFWLLLCLTLCQR